MSEMGRLRCSRCDEPRREGKRYCGSCGAGQNAGRDRGRTLGSRASFVLIGGLVAIVTAAAVLLLTGGDSAQDAVDDYLAALDEGDCKAAAEIDDSRVIPTRVLQACRAGDDTGLADYKVLNSTDDGDDARVEVRITFTSQGAERDAEEQVVVFLLAHVDGEWKIRDALQPS